MRDEIFLMSKVSSQEPSLRAERVSQIALVTAGLSVTGGVVGAVCGVTAVAIIAVADAGLGALTSDLGLQLVSLAAGAGAAAGMVGAPAIGWGALRRVPIGKSILVTALGTIAGAIGGQFLQRITDNVFFVPGIIAGAVGGFLAAGVGLRIASRQRAARPPVASEH